MKIMEAQCACVKLSYQFKHASTNNRKIMVAHMMYDRWGNSYALLLYH